MPFRENDLVLFEGRVCLVRGSYPVFGRTVFALSDPHDPMSPLAVGAGKISFVGRWDGTTPLLDVQHLAGEKDC